MEQIMRHTQRLIAFVSLLVVTATGAGCWLFGRNSQPSDKDTVKIAVSYSILEDDMTTTIRIGVNSSITEEQLRATLVRAANDHQDDPARDYLTSMFFWVEAYLVRDRDRSSVPAGRLKRYVPPGNPAERRKITTDRTKDDAFTITLDEAKKTLH
jgi:hypothetical protein